MRIIKKTSLFSMWILISMVAVACAPAAAEEPSQPAQPIQEIPAEESEPMEEIPVTGDENIADESGLEGSAVEILLRPAETIPEPIRTLADSDSSLRASEKRVLSGDKFLENLYERPFTALEMVYQPDLDIYTVDFTVDDNFFYFSINLNGKNPQEWGLNGLYGIEFDTDADGRGELIVMAEDIPAAWDFANLTVLIDQDSDVGGPQPIVADAGFSGSGYDQVKQIAGNEVAFARINPEDETSIQFAVSAQLLGGPDGFTWSAWADNGLRDFTRFDYNDTMGPSEAGSPFINSEDYPIDGLFNVDNTCRLAYGDVGPEYLIPGMCIIGAPTPVPDKDGCTWVCTVAGAPTQQRCNELQGQWVCR